MTMEFKKRPKPKLDRRNAVKNIDYDASFSPSPSPSTSTSFSHLDDLRARSLLDYKTSFRIQGIDGEFDLLCQTLGFSGPEDFAIPKAAWEARNRRFSSDFTASPSNPVKQDSFPAQLETKLMLSDSNGNANCNDVAFKQESVVSTRDNISNDLVGVGLSRGGGGGIKGERPRMLVPPPGMSARRLVVDDGSSTWDLLRSFAPPGDGDNDNDGGAGIDDEYLNRRIRNEDASVSSSGEEEENGMIELRKELGDGARDRGDVVVGGLVEDAVVYNAPPNGELRRSVGAWQKGELLGSGSFGTVYEGITDDGFFFAIKEVSLLDHGSQGRESILQLEQEISLLSKFEHKNIVRYLGTDKDESKLYIFLELATKGSLAKLYQKYNLRDSQVSAYTRQILDGLRYLHAQNVVHRDIKCANILVDTSGSVKLADFGLAKATVLSDIRSCKGTPFWMAPEVVNSKGHDGYGLAADIWSLGCTVLELLTRQPPYSHLEGMQALFRIGRGEPPSVPGSLSRDARDFILKCIQVNPKDRPTAAELSDHPFMKRPLSNLEYSSLLGCCELGFSTCMRVRTVMYKSERYSLPTSSIREAKS